MDKSWATLAACSKNECSYPDKKREQGIFTYYIAEAIKEWEKEKEITIEGIKIEVARRMEEWCNENGLYQHPTLNGSVVGIQNFAKRNNKIADISIEFGDFRNSLKCELFEKQTERMLLLTGSPYFYKRTTVRTLINLIASTEGAEYEIVSSNFASIIEVVWDSLASDDKYFVGTTYSKYVNRGEEKYICTFKKALEKVHGYDYVPENLRSISFIQAAKNIKKVHHEYNNFYNEPEAVRMLERLGHQIPKPALKESLSACIMVVLGNAYGTSEAALQPTYEILDKLDKDTWKYYITECLPFDDDVLYKIAAGDRRTSKWCEFVKRYSLDHFVIADKKIQDMMTAAGKEDKITTKVLANSIRIQNT